MEKSSAEAVNSGVFQVEQKHTGTQHSVEQTVDGSSEFFISWSFHITTECLSGTAWIEITSLCSIKAYLDAILDWGSHSK